MTFDLLYVTFLGIVEEWSKAKDDFEQSNGKPYRLTMFDYARTIDGFDEMVRCLIDSEIERGERCVNPTRFDIIIDYDILGNYKPNIDKNSKENYMIMCFRNVVIRSICEIYYDYEREWIDHVSTVRINNYNGTFSTKIIIDLIAPIPKLLKMQDALSDVSREDWDNGENLYY
mgnify:CR=1 FL=1